jgi:hypothetical protein
MLSRNQLYNIEGMWLNHRDTLASIHQLRDLKEQRNHVYKPIHFHSHQLEFLLDRQRRQKAI